MNNLAIIPARSGSKGLYNKNIMLLSGKPLIAYSIEAAQKSGMFDEVMVSTDSAKYAEIAKQYGAHVPFLRSKETASDDASSWSVVREVLNQYKKNGQSFDTVCLLQPTSPLRTEDDIKSAYDLYADKKANTVVSICECDHSPLLMNTISGDLILDHFLRIENCNRRQALATYYRISGAIYIVCVDLINRTDNIYQNSYAFIMPRERSIDIDTMLDFNIAEYLMAKKLGVF